MKNIVIVGCGKGIGLAIAKIVRTIVGYSLDGYHTTQLINRLKYAKP